MPELADLYIEGTIDTEEVVRTFGIKSDKNESIIDDLREFLDYLEGKETERANMKEIITEILYHSKHRYY